MRHEIIGVILGVGKHKEGENGSIEERKRMGNHMRKSCGNLLIYKKI